MENYYFGTLSKKEQQLYGQIREGLSSYLPSFRVSSVDVHVLTRIFELVRLDDPWLFYASDFQFAYCIDSSACDFYPKYYMSRKSAVEMASAVRTRLKRLCSPAVEKNEAVREQLIHDFICTGVRYDKLKKQYSHEIAGPLTLGTAVCEGIAKTVKAMCDYLGIWCIVVLSDADPSGGIKYRHAWNILRINGKYCHLDATFDCSLSHHGHVRYDYYNISDSAVFRDHEASIYPVPCCSADDESYYMKKKMVFSDLPKLEERLKQKAQKRTSFTFQLRDELLNNMTAEQMIGIIDGISGNCGCISFIGGNWKQGVLSVRFSEQAEERERKSPELEDKELLEIE